MRAAACVALLLCSCGPQPREAPFIAAPQPADAGFGAALPTGHTGYSHDSLADLFVALTHDTEWGDRRRALVRYDEPVRVALEGPGSAQYAPFLGDYLGRLRQFSGIDIAPASGPANMWVRFVAADDFQAVLPTLACVVTPGDLTWARFRDDPAALGTRAVLAAAEHRHTIFVPQSTRPDLVRACLIEEIAQGLGPGNDLWGLGPSIFNDDAAHLWPTALDHLMLRLLYRPEMRGGDPRADSRAKARALLPRINPAGDGAAPLPALHHDDMGEWRRVMLRIAARDTGAARMADLTRLAVALSATRAPDSPQHCHSLMSQALLDPGAVPVLSRARAVCARVHGAGDVRVARLDLERGWRLLESGDAAGALAQGQALLPIFRGLGQAQPLAWTFLLIAVAHRVQGAETEAAAAAAQALAWASYVYGTDGAEVAALRAEWKVGP